MPSQAGLGVHATLDIGRQYALRPDVEWVAEPDYTVDPARAESFYAAIREYWPDIPRGSLQPAYAGVRPKLVGPASPPGDFEIETRDTHGVAHLINLLGIESPGLTSSLAIAKRVAGTVRQCLTMQRPWGIIRAVRPVVVPSAVASSFMDFIDLKTQYQQVRESMNRRMQGGAEHGQYILGPRVRSSSHKSPEYVGVKHCIGASSGTDTLLIALRPYGIGRGDESDHLAVHLHRNGRDDRTRGR